jgi:hypothetical protein
MGNGNPDDNLETHCVYENNGTFSVWQSWATFWTDYFIAVIIFWILKRVFCRLYPFSLIIHNHHFVYFDSYLKNERLIPGKFQYFIHLMSWFRLEIRWGWARLHFPPHFRETANSDIGPNTGLSCLKHFCGSQNIARKGRTRLHLNYYQRIVQNYPHIGR